MADKPSDEQRWTPPSNEDLPGGSTPPLEGIPGADAGEAQSSSPQPGPPAFHPPSGGQSSGKATAALVFGILGLVFCGLLAPVALAFGYSARKEIDASGGRLGNRGLATAGVVLGWIGVGLLVLAVLVFIVLIIVAVAVEDSRTTSAIVSLLA